jgi:hypothetical protein
MSNFRIKCGWALIIELMVIMTFQIFKFSFKQKQR